MNTNHFKQKLLEEKNILEEEITEIGSLRISHENFQARAEEGVDQAENIELANMFEVESNKDAVLDQLENRLMAVERALSKLEEGTYGICEISGGCSNCMLQFADKYAHFTIVPNTLASGF